MSEEAEVVEPIAAAEPVAEAPETEVTAEGAEVPETVEATPETPPELTAEQRAAKKLEGRLGYKTKQLNEAATALANANKQIEAYQALLAERGTSEGEAPAPKPNTERTFTAKEVEAEAARIATTREFNTQADLAYEAGKAKFPDFDDAVATLRDVGAMTYPVVEAALATGDAAGVLHYLGQDPDEASRIANLPPVRMGVELARIAGKLSAPSKGAPVSRAPAPIRPVGGSASPTLDVYDPKLSTGDKVSAEYIALRAKQGAYWAR